MPLWGLFLLGHYPVLLLYPGSRLFTDCKRDETLLKYDPVQRLLPVGDHQVVVFVLGHADSSVLADV